MVSTKTHPITVPTSINNGFDADSLKATVEGAVQAASVAGDYVKSATEAISPALETAAAKGREFSDGYVAQVKKAATLSLDTYDRAVKNYTEFTIELAQATKLDWMHDLAVQNAKIVTEMAAVSSSMTRELLK